MIKKYWKVILIVVILLVVIGGVYYKFYYSNESTTQEKIDPKMQMEVKKGNLKKKIATEGYVEAVNKENLSFPARSSGSTKIEKIYIEEGDRVEKGQLLMELDKAEARLNYIKKKNIYNRAKINKSKNEIEEAKLDMELASSNLENMELKAPSSGIITEIYVEEGDYYTSGDAATVKDISRLEVKVNIEESDIPELELGQKAEITLKSLPGKTIAGEVVELEDEADNSGGIVTLPVTVLLEKVDYDIKLGCSAELDIIVGELKNQIIIPITAIITKNGRDFVMKVENDSSKQVPVETGLSNGLQVAVLSGLKPGDIIMRNTYSQNVSDRGEAPSGGMMRMGGGRD